MKPIEINFDFHNVMTVVNEFKKESDRGAAVLAGSLIENYLAKYLKFNMVKDPKINELFDGFGPFSDLSKRIECAYAFDLISLDQKKILNLIKNTRNYFAHNPFDAAFDKPPVSNWCSAISIRELLPKTAGPIEEDKSKDWDNKFRFLISIGIFIAEWEIKMGGDITTSLNQPMH